jgi:hypothetical protein
MTEIRYHYALSHLIIVELSCWMDEKQCFFTIFVRTFFSEKLSLRHPETDKFSGTGSPDRQILGPHIPEQSVRHHYF